MRMKRIRGLNKINNFLNEIIKMDYIIWLKNPLVAGTVAGIVLTLLAFIDSKYNDKPNKKDYYIKVFLSVFAVVTGLVYFAKDTQIIQSGGGGENIGVEIKKSGHHLPKVMKNNVDVYTNVPDW